MRRVGGALGHHVDHRAHVAAILGGVIGADLELGNGIRVSYAQLRTGD